VEPPAPAGTIRIMETRPAYLTGMHARAESSATMRVTTPVYLQRSVGRPSTNLLASLAPSVVPQPRRIGITRETVASYIAISGFAGAAVSSIFPERGSFLGGAILAALLYWLANRL
jgi:hypothetical protein